MVAYELLREMKADKVEYTEYGIMFIETVTYLDRNKILQVYIDEVQ